MQLLSRQEFADAPEVQVEWVPLPELGDDRGVYIRMLSGTERDAFEAGILSLKEQQAHLHNFRARYVALCASDDQGKPIFAAADVDWLGKKSGLLLDRLYDAARKLNGMFAEKDELRKI